MDDMAAFSCGLLLSQAGRFVYRLDFMQKTKAQPLFLQTCVHTLIHTNHSPLCTTHYAGI